MRILRISMYLFDIVSNNQNYLKIICRKSCTKKFWNFSGAPELLE